jgi:hypothetical protein
MYKIIKEHDLEFDELLHNPFNPFIALNKSITYICIKNETNKTVCEIKMEFVHNALEQTFDVIYRCELEQIDITNTEQKIGMGLFCAKLAIDKLQTQNKYDWIKRPKDKDEITKDLIRFTLRCPKAFN